MNKKETKKGSWGFNPVKKVTLTPSQISKLQERVKKGGEGRLKVRGKINEIDYLSGAMATMEALGIPCPAWVWGIMAGVKYIEKDK